jgi:hypothetical protein
LAEAGGRQVACSCGVRCLLRCSNPSDFRDPHKGGVLAPCTVHGTAIPPQASCFLSQFLSCSRTAQCYTTSDSCIPSLSRIHPQHGVWQHLFRRYSSCKSPNGHRPLIILLSQTISAAQRPTSSGRTAMTKRYARPIFLPPKVTRWMPTNALFPARTGSGWPNASPPPSASITAPFSTSSGRTCLRKNSLRWHPTRL